LSPVLVYKLVICINLISKNFELCPTLIKTLFMKILEIEFFENLNFSRVKRFFFKRTKS